MEYNYGWIPVLSQTTHFDLGELSIEFQSLNNNCVLFAHDIIPPDHYNVISGGILL